jgi:hypothetical protein
MISCETIDDCKIPNIIEKKILFNIAKNKEISLSNLLTKLKPMEKAFNRKIERDFVLKVVNKFIENGQVEKLYLNYQVKEGSEFSSKSIQGEDR